MPDQGKTKAAGDQGKYEYAFEAVPDSERKSGWGMFLVLAGYPIAVSNFVTGAAIGYQMTFVNALVSILVGDAFLIFIAVSTGIISFETGLSTSFLSRTVFGRKGSAIFSLLLVMSSITWIGINGDTFAQMVIANFPGCPIPAAVLAAVIILVWSISAMRGYRGLEIVSMIGVPTALVLALVVFVILGVNYGGYGVVLSYKPDPASTMPFSEAQATASAYQALSAISVKGRDSGGISRKETWISTRLAGILKVYSLPPLWVRSISLPLLSVTVRVSSS